MRRAMAFYHPLLFRLDAERAHGLTIAALGAWGAVQASAAGISIAAAVANRSSGLDAPRRKLKCVVTCSST